MVQRHSVTVDTLQTSIFWRERIWIGGAREGGGVDSFKWNLLDIECESKKPASILSAKIKKRTASIP